MENISASLRSKPSYFLDWQFMKAPDFEHLDPEKTVICVACSPLEVHGPHLPMVTDIWEATGLMEYTVERMQGAFSDWTFVRLPPLYVAADVVPQKGSIAFRTSTIIRTLCDIGRSVSKQGFRNIWVTSFHGGPRHFTSIEVACDRTNRRYGTRMVSVFSLLLNQITGGKSDLSEVFADVGGIDASDLEGDTHGGAVETSMMLYLLGKHIDPAYKELQQMTFAIKEAQKGNLSNSKKGRPTLWQLLYGFKYKIRYFETESYSGHPAVASPEVGQQMVEILSELSAGALERVLQGEIDMSACHSPLWKVRWLFTVPLVGWLFERLVGFKSQVW